MCGLVGCLALAAGVSPDADWVRIATARISHRGPDDDGYYTDSDVALGFKRLAIIDLSAGGHQPMRSADGRYCMVFNGEIYNYLELGEELQREGVRLRSTSDSEVLLEAYARHGKDVVRLLRGMFAFAVWDTVTRELFCARDPFGIKPFFYVIDSDRGPRQLRFASERKALAGAGEFRELDRVALNRYLGFQYVPAAETLTPPVRTLPAGHALTARPDGAVEVARYWRADLRPAPDPGRGTAADILAALRDSIGVHLRSDAPLGAFLSGGIDSAAICALAAERRPSLQTFTVGFEPGGYNEIDRAQETAAALGLKSLPYVITAEEFFANLPQIIWHLDDPLADASAVPLWFVAREASRFVKVVLSGEGSDELFGGYPIYREPPLVRAAAERLPSWGRVPLRRVASLFPPGVKGKAFLERLSTRLRRRYIGNARVYGNEQIDALVRRTWVPAQPDGAASTYSVTDPIFVQADEVGLDHVSTKQLVDINTWLAGDILVKADRMTMAHGLEMRVPFLDREVMRVAARLAPREKVDARTTKVALRQAMHSVLPARVAARAKLGFPVPIGLWLRAEAGEFAYRVLSEAQTDEWIDRPAALRLLQRFRAGHADVSWRHVWVLTVFSLWHQIYPEHVYDPVALGWERAPPGLSG